MIVYKITYKVNRKSYIGQTVQTLKRRMSQHYQNIRTSWIDRAIQKYGKENFEVKILTRCNSLDEMNHREQYYIKLFNTLAPNGFNLTTGGKNHHFSDQTRQKMSLKKKGRKNLNYKRTAPAWNRGIVGWKNSGGFKKGHSPSFPKSKWKSVKRSDGMVFESISAAARATCTAPGKICAVIRGKRNHTKGFTFTYMEN